MSYKLSLSKEEILRLGVHFGRSRRFTHRTMKDFVLGDMNGISIIDPDFFISKFEESLNILTDVIKNEGRVLFVTTNPAYFTMVKELAQATGQFSYAAKLVGGLLTNWYTIYKSVDLMKKTEIQIEEIESGKNLDVKYTKKELCKIKKEFESAREKFEGVKEMKRRPDIVVILDAKDDTEPFLSEIQKVSIPSIAFVDTNANLSLVKHPIPANSGCEKCVAFYIEEIKKAVDSAKISTQHNERTQKTPQEKTQDGSARKILTLKSGNGTGAKRPFKPFYKKTTEGNNGQERRK